MSLIETIENVHKKPEYLRRRVLYVSMFVIMFIVIAVWASTLRITLGETKGEEVAASPFTVFKDMAKESYGMLEGAFEQGFSKLEKAYAK